MHSFFSVDVNFEPVQSANGTWVFDIKQLLKSKNITMAINALDQAELNVELNGIHIRDTNDLNPFNDPTCMRIAATVSLPIDSIIVIYKVI